MAELSVNASALGLNGFTATLTGIANRAGAS
jgi:hypothetical protein